MSPTRTQQGGRGYISEVQGLRTLAALLVAAYHIWFNRVSGGVDVFFVVAAFFMMASFDRKGRISGADLIGYWSGTARRVVPVMAVVVAATLAAFWAFRVTVEWRSAIYHAAASTAFVENWWLAWNGTDYLAQDTLPSPFQQMWALSLQMQLAVLLPFALWAAGARAADPRRAWTATLVALFAGSFAYGLWITRANQPWAYFDSVARIWEYAAGALLALHADRIPRPSRRVLAALGAVAFVVVATFAAVLPVARLFPGIAATIPVGCTLAMIWVARSGVAIRPLRWKPMLALGDISFAFYLWHWPILVLWRHLNGSYHVGLLAGVAIILLAGILAALSVRFVERPVRRSPRLSARPVLGLFAGLATALVAVAALALFALDYKSERAASMAKLASFNDDPVAFRAAHPDAIVPDPLIVRSLWRAEYAPRCHQTREGFGLRECVYGKRDGAHTLVVHGGSHSIQWLPAIRALADELDLRIVQLTKAGCPTHDGALVGETVNKEVLAYFEGRSPSCAAWNEETKARVLELKPDIVLIIATWGVGKDESIPASFLSWWQSVTDAGIDLIALRDNPRFLDDVPSCVDRHRDDPSACDRDRSLLLLDDDPGAALDLDRVTYLDLTDLFCRGDLCGVVYDGVMLYRDGQHITGTLAEQSTDRLKAPIEEILERREAEKSAASLQQ